MTAQVFAVIIFLAMLILVITDKIERHYVTLVAAGLTMIFVFGVGLGSGEALMEVFNLKPFTQISFLIGESEESTGGINWQTIIFIAGMMVMVEGMGKSGFFKWLCLNLAKAVKYKTVPLLIAFMCLSTVLAMFIDSITVILFLAAVTVELAVLLHFSPVPLILAEIFCANLGGAATMCGDPPNIIIGTSLGLTFFDFLTNTGLVVLIMFAFTLIYFFLVMRKDLKKSELSRPEGIVYPNAKDAIVNKKTFISSVVIFGIIVVLLVSHAETGITVAAIGIIATILTTVLTLILGGLEDIKYIYKHVDYKTLLFFLGLFIVVGGLEQTGILVVIANFIANASGGNIFVMIAILIWISAIASAFIDNIPFAATMVPIIKAMSVTTGVDLNTLAYTLAIGADVGGSATPIGASANVVGTSAAAKAGHLITWKTYLKYSGPATIAAIVIAMLVIFARFCI